MQDDFEPPKLNFPNNPLKKLFGAEKRNTKLAITLSAVGLIIFLLVALLFSFKNQIFERFFPKSRIGAAACTNTIQIPSNRGGFVFTGGDLEQAISSLSTPLYYTNDLNLGPQKSIFTIGKYIQNQSDPLGLRILMENNLSNADFKGQQGQAPAGWNTANTQAGTASIDVEAIVQNTASKGTSINLSNNQNQTGTQIAQVYKKSVAEGQFIVFGAWVKAETSNDAKIVVQNSQSPYQQFGVADTSNIKPNKWTYVIGFGKVPTGVTNFQVALLNEGKGSTVSFQSVSVAALLSDISQTLSDLVLARCGGVWMVDDGMGYDATYSEPFLNPLLIDVYVLLYHQYYTQIKTIDPSAKVLPGGIMGSPIAFDNTNGYGPKIWLDNFRTSYKNFFGTEPPIDMLAIRYLATSSQQWLDSKDMENYLTSLRNYMDNVLGWKRTQIWISRLGVSSSAPNGGVDFVNATMKFLTNNSLNVEKWFWYDTCGINSQLNSLFISNNKICSWPMKLNALGQAYLSANAMPTATPTPIIVTTTSTPSATIAATATPTSVPTAIPNSPTPISTVSATPESTSGGTPTP